MRRRKTKPNPPVHDRESIPADPHDFDLDDLDGDAPLELDDEYWEALIPDDDYEPLPDPNDFYTD